MHTRGAEPGDSPALRTPPVMMVGNFLSSATGVRSVCEDLADRLTSEGWTVLTTSRRKRRITRLWDMMASVWYQRHRYEVAQVDVYSGPAFLWAEAVCTVLRRARKPYILTLHGGNLPLFALRAPKRVRRLLASATVVTAPSRYLQEQMRLYRDNLHLLPNPLDLSAYRFTARDQPKPSIVWLRSFHEIYNPELAPRVVQLLTQDFPGVHLTMVGPDTGDGSLQRTRQLVAQSGLGDHVSIIGKVPKSDVPTMLNKGDIFLNTSNIDNAPVSVLEAMACGLCVVSTNVGGIPYMLEHNSNALLVPPDNAEAMAAAVRRVLTEMDLAERLSYNARRKADQFDWHNIIPEWERLFTSLAQT